MTARFVTVTQHSAITCSYYYSVEIPDDVSDEDAGNWAVKQVRQGLADDPYDSHTGDALDGHDDDYDASDVQGTDPADDDGA